MQQETVGDRLKRVRLEHDMSQRELACDGVSYAYISRIEAGTRQPSVKALRRVAEKLGVTAEYLETGYDRTTTDGYAGELAAISGGGLALEYELEGERLGDWSVTWNHNGVHRTSSGASLTAALLSALAVHREFERLQSERERIDVEERALAAA